MRRGMVTCTEDGGCGRRIGRRDNRSQRERGIKWQPGIGDAEPRNGAGADQHRNDSKRKQGPPQPRDRAGREIERCVNQDRCNEQC